MRSVGITVERTIEWRETRIGSDGQEDKERRTTDSNGGGWKFLCGGSEPRNGVPDDR